MFIMLYLLRWQAVLALEQMPSGGISTAVQDTLVSDTKNPEIETRHEAHGGLIACENVTDSAMKPVAVEAGKRLAFVLRIPLHR